MVANWIIKNVDCGCVLYYYNSQYTKNYIEEELDITDSGGLTSDIRNATLFETEELAKDILELFTEKNSDVRGYLYQISKVYV